MDTQNSTGSRHPGNRSNQAPELLEVNMVVCFRAYEDPRDSNVGKHSNFAKFGTMSCNNRLQQAC